MFPLHIFSVVFSVCVVFLADKEAFSWILGRKEQLSHRKITVLHYLVWAGLISLIFSGSLLAFPRLDYLLGQPLFVMKMLFVMTLVVNAILLGRFSHIATTRPFSSLTWGESMPLFISGAVSSMSWAGALILALAFFK